MLKLFANKFAKAEARGVVREGMTLEQVLQAMLGLMAQANINHHHMGQYYNYVVNTKLAEKAGYKDARAWFSEHLVDLSQATLTTYGAVAAAFSEQVARRLGVTCLSLLLTYEEAAELEVNHEEPGATLIEVPDERGQVAAKPFSQCSVEEMRRALQRKRRPASSKPLPPEAVALADQYREAVTSRFPQGTLIKLQVRNHKGKAVVDLKGIPLDQMLRLAEAITSELPPVREVRLVEKVLPVA